MGIVVLPEHRWWVAESKWRGVEELGFDHAWTYDHLGWGAAPDGPWFSAVPTLAAAAAVTTRIGLGALVASPDFRHPVPFARDLLTLDDLSDGRLVVGVGAGGDAHDAALLGVEPPEAGVRAARFAEFVEVLDQLLAQDRTTFRGEHFTAVDARSAPGCVQRPRAPFVVMADDAASLAVAARHSAGWITSGRPADDDEAWWRGVAELADRFTEADARQQAEQRPGHRRRRAPARYLHLDAAPTYSLSSVESFRDAVGRAHEAGFTDVLAHWPRADEPFAGREAVLEQVAADVLPELVGQAPGSS